MAADGLPVQVACRMLQVSESGYYAALHAAPCERTIRHAWLTDVIVKVHADSRETYGTRRVHAELTLGHWLTVGYEQVTLLMRRAGVQGTSGRPAWRRAPELPTAVDLVDRQLARYRTRSAVADRYHRASHPRGQGRLPWARRLLTSVVGWSVDSAQTAVLVTSALARHGHRLSYSERRHADPLRTRRAIHLMGLRAASTRLGARAVDGIDRRLLRLSVIESFWSGVRVELLDRKRWKTRVELASAIFEYLEILHNRQRPTQCFACSPRSSSKRNTYPSPQLDTSESSFRLATGSKDPPGSPPIG
jgi:putative transposase